MTGIMGPGGPGSYAGDMKQQTSGGIMKKYGFTAAILAAAVSVANATGPCEDSPTS
jgi:hypothetical protein